MKPDSILSATLVGIVLALLITCPSLAYAGNTLGLLGDRHPDVLYSVDTDQPVIALTIDDAPDPVSTRSILDVLAENEATATFFIIADRVPGNEALLEAIVASGHELGNHLTRDEPSIDLSPERFEEELIRSHTALSHFAEPRWFRPGSGWYDEWMVELLAKHNYRCALGSVYPVDAQIPWSWVAQQVILWMSSPGDIIILHDSGSRGLRTARTLSKALPRLRKKGYRIVSLTELVSMTGSQDSTEEQGAADPLSARYTIEGQEIALTDGRHEMQAAPGSATRITTAVFDTPVYGDLDGDGDDDVTLFLVYQPGGSGTFYYVAAALNEDDNYVGTNAVLLGDRIAPQTLSLRNGVVITTYADRRLEESMTTPPTIAKSTYLTLDDGNLKPMRPLAEGEQVFEGWVTIGHEVRSFVPCSENEDHWLLGSSPALAEILAAYHQALPNAKPYTPLFMILAGNVAEPPKDGFGADYEAGFRATQLVKVSPRGNCRSEYIVVDSPVAGQVIASPLRICGRARGTWFFEGDFPVVLTDAKGNILARSFVTAQGEWMTKDFVPFQGMLEFKKPASGARGTLVLKKDNPTGLPEHDDEVTIPVFFEWTVTGEQ